jgi:UDP-glucose 4-epimerase
MALKYKKIHVKGDKNRFRDFVYIDDVVDAFIKAYKNNSQEYKVYNICTGIKTTVGELIETMLKYIPFKVHVKYEGSTLGDQFGIYGDNSFIKNELGWKPKYLLEYGLKKMVNWANLKI